MTVRISFTVGTEITVFTFSHNKTKKQPDTMNQEQHQEPQQNYVHLQYEPPVHTQPNQTSGNEIWVEPTSSQLDPIIAVILSLLVLPGLGHILIGQTQKGISYVIHFVIAWFIIVFLSVFFIGIYFLPCLFVWEILILIDAYKIGVKLKEGSPVMQGECANKFAAIGLGSYGLVQGPIFDNSDPTNVPAEWLARQKQTA
jgi:TM2 domain-containing membrane protein YozV